MSSAIKLLVNFKRFLDPPEKYCFYEQIVANISKIIAVESLYKFYENYFVYT